MPLQISAFSGMVAATPDGQRMQVAQGAPKAVSSASLAGSYTVPDDCFLLKIKGTGTITWNGIANAEAFDGIEWRGVWPGQQFTVA